MRSPFLIREDATLNIRIDDSSLFMIDNTFFSIFDFSLFLLLSTNSYHAGDAVPVKWFYEGEGENFSIILLKSGEQVADLCAAEEDGVCFDLTQDQTVLLPESG